MNLRRTSNSLGRLALVSALVVGLQAPLAPSAFAQEAVSPARGVATGGDLVGYNSIHHPAIGRDGMVVAQSKIAARIGAEILRKGGNAVDAAVAVGIAETMSLPRAGNIGGGGYMLVYDAATKKTVAIEYYGQAPNAVTPELLLGDDGKLSKPRSCPSRV